MLFPSSVGAPSRRTLLWLWAFLATIPVAYIGAEVVASSRNVVFWDEFSSLDFVLGLKSHPAWTDLIGRFFSVDSEHRTFTTRLIFAIHYWLTGEVNFHVIGAIGNLSLLTFCGFLIAETAGWERRLRLAIVLAFGLFQLEHFESFVWSGASIDHFLVVMLAGTSFIALHRGTRQATVIAALLALLASLTLAHGCLAWPIGALMLWRDRRWRHLTAWLALSAVALGIYFFGFEIDPSHRPGLSFGSLYRVGEYWLALLGSAPVLGQRAIAPYAGLGLLMLLGWLLWSGSWRRQPLAMPLAFFAIASLALVAVGRVGVAGNHMINSRYFVLGALAWTMTAFMLLEHFTPAERPFCRLAWALPVLAVFNISADLQFAPLAQTMVEARDRAASRFKQFGEDGHGIFRLNPFDGRAEEVLQRARAAGIYRLPRYSEPREFPSVRESTRMITYVDELIANGRAITVGGWAMIPGEVSKRGHVYVVLKSAHSVQVFSTLTLLRNDVATAYKEPRWRMSGFRAVIGRDRLPKENFDVGVLIADGDDAEYRMTSNRVLLSGEDPAAIHPANHFAGQ
jgi:hypothetical protein